ncbi:trypsin-like peptidase domain-containing protein [Micromonospora sp. CA-240977]|uniref:trypsin-like peptidase domain-containing protein n=1 Tax=Micromonospora sp. CA-240977 TaxID=3239957 RepID=UPI003D94BFD2
MIVSLGTEPWPVRLRDQHGGVLGAGMALDDRHVLTCAHVVAAAGDPSHAGAEPTWTVLADLVGQPGDPTVPAQVVAGCWWPPTSDGRDDIALLELAAPAPHGPFAPLRRMRGTWDRRVVMYGFPETVVHGVYVEARLTGRSGAGRERVEMISATTGPQVSPGFSGSAVVDAQTGHVVGMVVSTYRDGGRNQDVAGGADPGSGLSWMIPVETILGRLPRLRAQVPGESSVDPSFRSAEDTPANQGVLRQLADFFGRLSSDNVLVIVVDHRESDVAAAVRQAAVLSSRELRPSIDPETIPDAPPIGSIDLAVDATDRSTKDVSRRIADWAGQADAASTAPGHDRAADTAPRSIIINNIDEAAEPETLLSEVVLPLVGEAPTRDLRMLLTFRGESIPLRTTLLASRVASLQATEEATRRAYRSAAAVVADVPRLQPRATELRIQLTKLRAAAATTDGDTLAALLASTERATDRALSNAESVRREIVAREDLWSELHGRLGAYRAMAVQHRLAEDPALGTSYRRAYDLLLTAPCDLVAAEAAVRRYTEAVSHHVDGRRGGDGS